MTALEYCRKVEHVLEFQVVVVYVIPLPLAQMPDIVSSVLLEEAGSRVPPRFGHRKSRYIEIVVAMTREVLSAEKCGSANPAY